MRTEHKAWPDIQKSCMWLKLPQQNHALSCEVTEVAVILFFCIVMYIQVK